MSPELTAQAFTKLLESLGEDREEAGKKYEELRSDLISFFEQRGSAFPEEQTDETFNRVATTLVDGVVPKNVDYYYKIALYVCMGSLKGTASRCEQGA